MAEGRQYDTLHFPDYLDGTASASATLWQDQPQALMSRAPVTLEAVPPSVHDDLALDRYDALARYALGARVRSADYPGGRTRDSWRVHLDDGRSVIFTRRANPMRAMLEARVMQRLAANGAPIPQPLFFNGLMLIQEDVGTTRVSDLLLAGTNAATYRTAMTALIDSMWVIYRAGDQANLTPHVPIIGRSADWVTGFVDRTALIGHRVGVACPKPEVTRLKALLTVYQPEFVKWDARPANAIARGDGRMCWFDWEHCGARHRLDDLAWILGDDGNPDFADAEMALIETLLPRYATGPLGRHAREYFFAFGASHVSVRLARILANKGDDAWPPEDAVNTKDQERIRRSEALTLCRRAARWCRETRSLTKLGPWYDEVAAAIASG